MLSRVDKVQKSSNQAPSLAMKGRPYATDTSVRFVSLCPETPSMYSRHGPAQIAIARAGAAAAPHAARQSSGTDTRILISE